MTNFKCVLSLTKGHKILRGSYDVVAHIVAAYKRAKRSLFVSDEVVYGVSASDIKSAKFINEYTGEVYLEIGGGVV